MRLLAAYPSLELREGTRPGTCVLVGREGVDPALVEVRLTQIARAHQAVSHPSFPRVEALERGALVFSSDAVTDLEACVARAEERGERVPYAVGVALPLLLTDAMTHAHEARGDERLWVFQGGASLRNVRVRPSGQIHIFGLGHNFVVRHLDDTPAIDPGIFVGDREPSPTSDLRASYEMVRSLVPLVDLPPSLERVFQGRGDAPFRLRELLDWAMRKLLGRTPHDRGVTVKEAMKVYRIAWRLLGVTPDVAAFEDLLRRMASPRADEDRIILDGHRVVWSSGRTIDLLRRGAARRMLSALEEATREGRGLSTDDLFAAGWPGQRLDPETRSRRVRVELSRLRALGLRDAIAHGDEGFTLRLRAADPRPERPNLLQPPPQLCRKQDDCSARPLRHTPAASSSYPGHEGHCADGGDVCRGGPAPTWTRSSTACCTTAPSGCASQS